MKERKKERKRKKKVKKKFKFQAIQNEEHSGRLKNT